MAAAQVMGNDVTVTIAGASGNLELNVYKPVLIYNVLQSITLLADAMESLRIRCVDGIEPNKERIQKHLDSSLMLVTALNRVLGYDKAAAIARHAYEENISLRDAAVTLGLLGGEEFDRLVRPEEMISPKAIDTDQ